MQYHGRSIWCQRKPERAVGKRWWLLCHHPRQPSHVCLIEEVFAEVHAVLALIAAGPCPPHLNVPRRRPRIGLAEEGRERRAAMNRTRRTRTSSSEIATERMPGASTDPIPDTALRVRVVLHGLMSASRAASFREIVREPLVVRIG